MLQICGKYAEYVLIYANMSNTWENVICNQYALKYAKYENKNAI